MRRNFIVIVTALFAVTVLMSGAALAQGIKVAFVDFKKFADKSARAKGQQEKFTALVKRERSKLEKMRNDLQKMTEELQRQGPMLKEEMRNAKIKEIGIKKMEFELAEKEAQKALQDAQREQQNIFRQDISKIISAIRKQMKYDIIYDSVALLSADDKLDITAEVAKRYDMAGKASTHAPKAKPKPRPAPTKPATSGKKK